LDVEIQQNAISFLFNIYKIYVCQESVCQMSAGQVSVCQLSYDQMSICQMSVCQLSCDQISVGQVSVGQLFFEKMPVGPMSVGLRKVYWPNVSLSNGYCKELLLKGKAQYGWPPCTNKFIKWKYYSPL
jgi:hypothetical protein